MKRLLSVLCLLSLTACAHKPQSPKTSRNPASAEKPSRVVLHFSAPGQYEKINAVTEVEALVAGPTVTFSQPAKHFLEQVEVTSQVVPHSLQIQGSYEALYGFFNTGERPTYRFASENDYVQITSILRTNKNPPHLFYYSDAAPCSKEDIAQRQEWARNQLHWTDWLAVTAGFQPQPKVSADCTKRFERPLGVVGVVVIVEGNTRFTEHMKSDNVYLAFMARNCDGGQLGLGAKCRNVQKIISELGDDPAYTLDQRMEQAKIIVEAINSGASTEQSVAAALKR